MIINLLRKHHMTSLELPNKINGQYYLTDIDDNHDESEIIAIEGIDNAWMLKVNKKFHFENADIKHIILQEDQIYHLRDENKESLFVHVEKEYRFVHYNKFTLKQNKITIGRNTDSSIVINNGMTSSKHAILTYVNERWNIQDQDSKNGTYVNQMKCTKAELKPGDLIHILGTKIIIGKDFISIGISEDIHINEHHLERMHFPSIEFSENEEEVEHPYFFQSPRLKTDVQEHLFKVDSPPDDQIGEEIPFMMVIGPSITMGIASLSTGLFAVNNAISSGNISAAMPSIVMSISMLLGTVMWPIITKKYEKKRKREKEALRQKKYSEYLDALEIDIKTELENQQVILCENSPRPEECVKRIKNIERRLWDRTIKQNDFLNIRLGIGKKKMAAKFSYSERKFTLVDDNLKERLYSICENEKYVREVPITISLFDNYISGIIGKREITEKAVINIITQLVTFYSYDELKLVFLYEKNDHAYDFVKWLPHTFDDRKRNRFIAKNRTEMKELSTYFEGIISYRQSLNENDIEEVVPYYIIFVLDKALGSKFDVIKSVEKAKTNLHISVLNVCNEIKDLPKACKSVIEITAERGNLYDLSDLTGKKINFKPDKDEVDGNEISKRLANIALDFSENDKLPQMITFLQMFQVGKIEHLNPLLRWKENDPTTTLEAPVGVDTQGELFKLDLHEKYHGPHGLIAGMTGSGKSEFIITFILSMALNYHPEEVSFILIDYKGGGMAKAFESLPHVAGIITNLDGASVKRSLITIESELKRRQNMFAMTSKAMDISNLDIYKYQKLYRDRKVQEPLSHLLIISDEFAELKTQQPEFMNQLVSAARIGRSLGVHLILATQKPSGVVDDQIWSNSRFRVCLKVQERSDSMDMLKRVDAAELVETGRFYLQVGYNEMFEIGQSAWSGAPYYPSDRVIKDKDNSVAIIDITGHDIGRMAYNKQSSSNSNAKKQLDAITSFLAETAKSEGIKIRPIWLDPIPENIYYIDLLNKYDYGRCEGVCEAIIGELDNPANQKQGLFTISLCKMGNIAVYEANGNGRIMFITAMLYSLCHNHSAQEVQVYAMDFSGGVLKCFDDAPQVGDIILQDEHEKVENLLKMLNTKLTTRKKTFANFGGDIHAYNKLNKKKAYEIIVIIDNIAAFNELYEDKEEQVTYLLREGNKYGIYFVVTTSSLSGIKYRMQQCFSQNIALRMNDESDYLSVIGKTEGMIPENYEGRGLVKLNGEIYEFQTAHIVENANVFEEIKLFCSALQRSAMVSAEPIPVLPQKVTEEMMKKEYKGGLKIPVGIDYGLLKTVYYDFSKNYISCVLSSYQENALVVASILTIVGNDYTKYVLDMGDNRYEGVNHVATTISKCEEIIDTLFDLILLRNNLYKEADNPKELSQTFDKIVIILNGFTDIANGIHEQSLEKLDLLLEKGAAEYKVNIIISDNMALNSFTYKSWFKLKVNTSDFIWIGGNMNDQYTFQPSRKTISTSDAIEKDSGYVIEAASTRKVKFVFQEVYENE